MSKLKLQPTNNKTSLVQKLRNFCKCLSSNTNEYEEQATEVITENTNTLTNSKTINTLFPIDYSVNYLDLSFKKFNEKNLREYAKILICSPVTKLNLHLNCLGNKLAITLAGILKVSQIENLNLSSNLIEDEGIIAIFSNLPESIRSLNIGDNKFGDAGLAALTAKLPDTKITFLDLRQNAITTIGFKKLSLVLPKTQIEYLNVSGNFSHKEGITLIELNTPSTIKFLDTRCYNNEAKDLIGGIIGEVIEYEF
ncbi:leucine-rich repeat domain-containing protein [Candidatus Trichorickettsia mobilis]|uniref:hypothetical protein n=1 Tax=Candidatus Trichorickettsia mobilis TaxID=1346319 RepID=UPI0029302ACC|nr:hypothetical protein [Candidatus Trichorickettsia mobilis]